MWLCGLKGSNDQSGTLPVSELDADTMGPCAGQSHGPSTWKLHKLRSPTRNSLGTCSSRVGCVPNSKHYTSTRATASADHGQEQPHGPYGRAPEMTDATGELIPMSNPLTPGVSRVGWKAAIDEQNSGDSRVLGEFPILASLLRHSSARREHR